MTLKQYKDDFKASFNWNEAISIGKIDNNKEKAICFYNSKRTLSPVKAIDESSYKYKPITILLRYTKNQDTAEQMANSIYEFYDDRTFNIENKRVYAQHLYSNPMNLGTDENGVYEYSIELNILEER
jgi:hypothetical protein